MKYTLDPAISREYDPQQRAALRKVAAQQTILEQLELDTLVKLAARNKAILECKDMGITGADIARATGLSQATVSITRHTESEN